jgi:hypothetical protein
MHDLRGVWAPGGKNLRWKRYKDSYSVITSLWTFVLLEACISGFWRQAADEQMPARGRRLHVQLYI